MTATANEPQTARRSKAGIYADQLYALQAKEQELQELLADAPASEERARREALISSPLTLPDALSPVEKERTRRRKLEATLQQVRANAATFQSLLDEERAANREEALAGINRHVAELQDAIRDELRSLCEQIAEAHETYLAYAAGIIALEQYRSYGDGVAVTLGTDHERWKREVARFPVTPVPGTFQALLDDILELSFDPQGFGWLDPESKGRGRDEHGELRRLVVDLRGKSRDVSSIAGVEMRNPREPERIWRHPPNASWGG